MVMAGHHHWNLRQVEQQVQVEHLNVFKILSIAHTQVTDQLSAT
jgi:hypothetical protein